MVLLYNAFPSYKSLITEYTYIVKTDRPIIIIRNVFCGGPLHSSLFMAISHCKDFLSS